MTRERATGLPDDPLYETVRAFVSRQICIPIEELTPNARFAHDLGLDGDPAEELLTEFQREFDIDFTDLKYDDHFGPELSPFNPFILLLPSVWKTINQSRNDRGMIPKIPLTIVDFYNAAKTKRWPDLRDRPHE